MIIHIGQYCGIDLANMILKSANGCQRLVWYGSGSGVSKIVLLKIYPKIIYYYKDALS